MKKVLIVSYMFPPIAGIGAQRPLKFIKYLPSFGIEPVVFCPGNAVWQAQDPASVDLPYLLRTEIHRCGIKRLKPYYNLRFVKGYRNHPYFYVLGLVYIWFLDIFSSWYFECRREILELAEKEEVNCVFTTSPPHSTHLFGLHIKRKLGIPWVMDLRDAMYAEPGKTFRTVIPVIQTAVEFFYERIFYRSSDAIISVSQPIIDSLCARHSSLRCRDKSHVIYNGFDEEDFIGLTADYRVRDRLIITYPGTFKGKHTPEHFLKALHLLIVEKKVDPSDLLIRFIGSFDDKILTTIKRLSSGIPVETKDFVPHRESLTYQISSDLLLMILNFDEKENGSQVFTGKFFEYLGAEKPIFALIPEGPLKEIIEKGRFGTVVPPKDIPKIANALQGVYAQWKTRGNIPFDPDIELRNLFTRRRLTEKISEIIHDLTDG